MVWGCFSYYKKGPLHIWKPETAKQKREASNEIRKLNEELEPIRKQEWEMTTSLARMKLRTGRTPGREPKWSWNRANSRLERETGGGIDWYRYYEVSYFFLSISMQELTESLNLGRPCSKIDPPNTIILEDGAPAHRHHFQNTVYSIFGIQKILDWPGNSPDLNAIEAAWPWMKRRTTSRGAPRDKKTAEEAWFKAWEELSQEKIQHWIERLMRHIQEIIRLEGGNEYKEGRTGSDKREWKGVRIKGYLSKREDLGEGPLF
ncbi:uncharacterized protein AKAW2_50005S [Aspergillus luchuensis]|uniref:Tc1-like transposase DDE domain-containing protein n=1 Tax=Aspergillus kawachii TaxID=1069201 RepID=A0A7R7ZYM7_ASPKA|nr:uncharacterized protein AKAW2_50005S [Aspergillus luchuensis]BCR99663.1 hypothetical protein AKAW2_50005S [Aspergillus luchuensis]